MSDLSENKVLASDPISKAIHWLTIRAERQFSSMAVFYAGLYSLAALAVAIVALIQLIQVGSIDSILVPLCAMFLVGRLFLIKKEGIAIRAIAGILVLTMIVLLSVIVFANPQPRLSSAGTIYVLGLIAHVPMIFRLIIQPRPRNDLTSASESTE